MKTFTSFAVLAVAIIAMLGVAMAFPSPDLEAAESANGYGWGGYGHGYGGYHQGYGRGYGNGYGHGGYGGHHHGHWGK